jgi:tetratricopeptide (TPR) repeat protein
MHRLYVYLGILTCLSGASAASIVTCAPPKTFQEKLQGRPGAETYQQLGNWFADHQKYDCAVETYRSGLKRAPRSSELLYLLGLNLLRRNDSEAAVGPLQQSIELKPDVIKAHLLLATALEQIHRPVDARKEWFAALRLDPQSEMALDGASKNLLAVRQFTAVMRLLGSAPQEEDLIVDLAEAYQGFGNQDRASELLEKAVAAKPSSITLTRALITHLVSQVRYEQALEYARKLAEQNPRDFDAQVLYLHVLVLASHEDEARSLAHKLFAAAPHDFGVLYLNGVLESRSGDYDRARAHLEEAVKANPNHYNSHFNLGITLSQLHDYSGAKEQFEKALALGATEPQVRFEYFKALRALGQTQLAAEQLQLYQKEQKEQADRTKAALKSGQAEKEMESGNYQKAVDLYRDAVAAQPGNAMLNFKLSLALERIGDRKGEMEVLKKTVELDPSMAIAHYQLGYVAAARGDFALAEQEYGKAVAAAPAYLEAWIGLAGVLGTESRFSEAQKAVENALKIDPKDPNAIELQKELANAATQAGQ